MLDIKYPDPNIAIEDQSDIILLTMCIWAEARGEQTIGQIAVGCCIRNRVIDPRANWWGNTWREVILKPRQFSSFNKDLPSTPLNEEDPNRKKLLSPLAYGTVSEWSRCFYVAIGIFENLVNDVSRGANHYYSIPNYDISIPAPYWAVGKTPVFTWGILKFYKL